MKKVIKAQDIRNMVKMFNLDEYEQNELEDMAECINKEKGSIAYEVQSTMLYGSRIKERVNALNSLLLYFGKKVQKEIGWKLRETTWELENLLKIGSYQIRQWFNSMKLDLRFKKYLEVSDTFGLNYLEIA